MSEKLDNNSLQKLNDDYSKKVLTYSNTLKFERLDRLIKYFNIKETDIVADFGCGNAFLYELIHKDLKKYYGIDFSESAINQAKVKLKNMDLNNHELHLKDISDFSSGHQDFFDKAFTLDFSEHIYDQQFISIYKSVKNTLKDDGQLFIYTPNREYILEIFKEHGIMKQLVEHIAVRTDKHYIKLLEEVGFSKIEIKKISHYNVFKYFHFLSYLPLVGKYFKARLLIICRK